MVFRVLLVCLLMAGPARSIAQIDSLKTTEQIEQFVNKVTPHYGSIRSIFRFRFIRKSPFDSLVSRYQLHPMEKLDIDGNGKTDLIFNGSTFAYSRPDSFPMPMSLAILSFGNDSFQVHDLRLGFSEDVAAHAIVLHGHSYMQVIRVIPNHNYMVDSPEFHIDTLACKYEAFFEKQPSVKRRITQIDYNCWNGLAPWAAMDLRIINDSVRLTKDILEMGDGIERGGVYLTRLDSYSSRKLYGLLDAIDFVNLKDSFSANVTDATTGTFRIRYDNGQIKRIEDYGPCGTYGLSELHRLLYSLRWTQHWTSADPPPQRNIDSLHSDRDVLGLIRTLSDRYPYLEFEPDGPVDGVHDYAQRLKKFGERRWQKADIDGNGYTDLLFNGYMNRDDRSDHYSIVVMNFGKDSLQSKPISWANGFSAAKIIRYDGHDYVKIKSVEVIEDSTVKKGYHLIERDDTLTSFDGNVVECSPRIPHQIESLSVWSEMGKDSVLVTRDTIYWYKDDAPPPDYVGDSAIVHKDCINLYLLVEPGIGQKPLSMTAGIRFERLSPELLLPTQFMKSFGSTWHIRYDGGKQVQLTTDGIPGSYRLEAAGARLWDIKHNRTDWKLSPRQQQQP